MKSFVQFILFSGALLLSEGLQAQAALVALIFGDKVASEKFNISMEVGANFAHLSNTNKITRYRGDLNFGIGANYMLSEHWFLSPNAYFISKRTLELSGMTPGTTDQILNLKFANSDAGLTANYVDVPIMVYREFGKRKFRLGLGPQVSFLKNAEVIYEGPTGNLEVDYTSNVTGIDYGLLSSFGYSLGEARKGKGLFLHVRYYQGFTDVSTAITGNNRASYLAFHVSLPFVTDAIASENLKKAKGGK
jgi:hypothetical protein